MGRRIVIMAGGTGGHVFPALAVALLMRERDWDVSWMGTQSGLEGRVAPEHKFEIDWLKVAGLRGKGVWAKIKAPWMLLKSCSQAWKILRDRKPDVVLGMGGFAAGPGGLMAKMLGIPLIIHEQNRVPGTTNRLLAKFANKVLEAFPDSFPKSVKAICTGNPLRKEISAMGGHRSERQVPIKLLVVGGSLGAKILNETVPEAASRLKGISVKHQTGKVMADEVKASYEKLGVEAEVLSFIEDMAAAYQWADLIICRSGAMTVSEIAAAGLPGIMIPYPYAIDDHQTANARFLTDSNAGVLIHQNELNAEKLAKEITNILENPNGLDDMSQAASSCARLDAATVVADICIQEAVR